MSIFVTMGNHKSGEGGGVKKVLAIGLKKALPKTINDIEL